MQRKVQHAGTFYPRFANHLKSDIEEWTAGFPEPERKGRTIALIVPHAGYMYSGKCAAKGFHSISNEHIETFIILHPSHQGNSFDVSVSPFDSYETPLGDIMLDEELADYFSGFYPQTIHDGYHQREHSMEIQLPLIKQYFPQAKICPIMFGRQTPEVSEELATILYGLFMKNEKPIALVVSTDLSHYHPAAVANELDRVVQQHVLDLDADSLWADSLIDDCEACGIGGLMTALKMAKLFSAARSEIIEYTHSGRVSGNNSQVVGYLAARISV
ncbi:MAG TPA: AmmeMemoRadiSam system protein B [Candidatus Cloacimonadota bacterium]|nr:AmmeMemoRadiSam system protein B [Candidatus Cloacimonadota bacterium]